MRAKPFVPPISLPAIRVPAWLLPLALEIQETRVEAERNGSLRARLKNVRTDDHRRHEPGEGHGEESN